MSTYDQVEDNLATFKEFKLLDQDEEKLVEKVANMIKAKTKNGCTGCRYCMPCPFGIDIPGNFKLWNEYGMLGLKDTAKRRYTNLGDAQLRTSEHRSMYSYVRLSIDRCTATYV